jgi:hypothetical protein
VGVFMIFAVKNDEKNNIFNFDSMIIKTGLMGTMGNKGSCLVRFQCLDTTYAFACSHLAAGSGANSSRISEIIEILNKNYPVHKRKTFKEHDIYFILGDLNFRCEIDYSTCINLINKKDLETLLDCDQLIKSRKNPYLNELDEGKIKFNPTYKYVIGTSEYDSKSKRVPSWCDRILFKKSEFLTQTCYDRAEMTISDHKPVYSIFKTYAIKELKEEKAKIIKEIKANMILGVKSSQVFEDKNDTESLNRYYEKSERKSGEKNIFDYFK